MSATTAGGFGGMPRAERLRRLARLQRLSRMMDSAVRIPILGIRFGADSVAGLVPGIGDGFGFLVGLYMVNEARKIGLPGHKLAQMVVNLGLDAALGSVPIAGDVFDVFFKANQRNMALLLDHFEEDRADLAKDITPPRR
ncbi:DUF4112 domain-containing protein [Mangrovibrevibacter kandeliae]|uniref:DUF4112 domain-containing protein n=1 Tax=Mangrovibrevibacter kandeliae TaxID=2968473 RepID=UPI002118DC66|nr:DUF4112 domain-containing protein [Aurantimonas sp. CSK15Z-1]MCQ8783947.1 DUF4112 domain-containing protein [Aurantimonas sp. CSK15Z-1]